MSQPLWQFFDTLGKPVTRENLVDLCVVAASASAIFYYGWVGPERVRLKFMASEFAQMYCKTRQLSFWHPYANLSRDTLAMYSADANVIGDKATLVAIFSTLDDATTEMDAVIAKHGLPKL